MCLAPADTAAALDGLKDWTQAIAFSPDGQTLAVLSFPAVRNAPQAWQIVLWNWRSDAKRQWVGSVGRAPTFSPDGTRLAMADPSGSAEIWDVESGRRLMKLAGNAAGVDDVAFIGPESNVQPSRAPHPASDTFGNPASKAEDPPLTSSGGDPDDDERPLASPHTTTRQGSRICRSSRLTTGCW